MGANNQGIMHLATAKGGLPACKNRNGHMSTTLDAFEECGRKCVRCAKHAEAWKRMRAKRQEREAADYHAARFMQAEALCTTDGAL